MLTAKRVNARCFNNNIVAQNQHGFTKNKSVQTANAEYVQQVMPELDQSKFVLGVHFDLSCAFDAVNHDFLKDKLSAISISGIAQT